MGSLSGKNAVVTGSTSGIGLAYARAFAGAGANVVINGFGTPEDIEKERAKIESDFGVKAVYSPADMTKPAEIAGMIGLGEKTFGSVDILVNNAGITGANKPVWETDLDDWRRVMRINLEGPFICCKAVVPTMIGQKYGRIVNIASIAGKEGNPNAAHYSSSKAGLIALTKSLGKELAQHDILVNAVTPAAAKTAIFDQMTQAHIDFMLSKIPKARFVQVEELAAMVAWLASEDCAFSTGAVFDISGGRATY